MTECYKNLEDGLYKNIADWTHKVTEQKEQIRLKQIKNTQAK